MLPVLSKIENENSLGFESKVIDKVSHHFVSFDALLNN